MTEKLVGSHISLITNAKIRYEGTLMMVDKTERAMHLSDVQSFGTEGRQAEGQPNVPPREGKIKSVIFKIDMIQDFQIVKRAEAEPTKEAEEDPAILAQESKQPKVEKPRER
jgi:hypothetical protein